MPTWAINYGISAGVTEHPPGLLVVEYIACFHKWDRLSCTIPEHKIEPFLGDEMTKREVQRPFMSF